MNGLGFDSDDLYELRLLREQQQREELIIGKIAEQIIPVMGKPKTYAMDIDGVLTYHNTEWPPEKIGKPLKPGIEMAKRIKAAGHKLVILTAKPKSCHAKLKAVLAKQGVEVDDITNTKPPAEMYLDDRAVRWPRNYNGGRTRESGFREGGPGSGPRPGHGKSDSEKRVTVGVQDIKKVVGKIRNIKDFRYAGREYGTDDKGRFSLRWKPDRFPRQALFEKFGVGKKDYDDLNTLINTVASAGSNKDFEDFEKVASKLAKGNLSDGITRAMAVEQALTQRMLGNRDIKMYRGFSAVSPDKVSIGHDRRTVSYWSPSKNEALRYARGDVEFKGANSFKSGVLVKAKVPTDRIISTSDTNKMFGEGGFSAGRIAIVVHSGLPLKYKRKVKGKDEGQDR